MTTISETLAIAVGHHQAGRLQAAAQLYQQILALQPDHAEAWQLLGVVACQAGKHPIAVDCIRRAIALDGSKAAFHSNLGNVFKEQGKREEAIACYRRALELEPGSVEAHNNLGNALKEQGKLAEAVACYRRALEKKPDSAEACYNLAIALRDQGDLDEAVAGFRRTLQLKPNFAEAHHNLGSALKDQGKRDEAIASYRRALELRPDSSSESNLAAALLDLGRTEEAVACFRRAVQLEQAAAVDSAGDCRGPAAARRAAAAPRPQRAERQHILAEAFRQLATILRGRLPEDDVRSMRQLLSDPDLGEDSRTALQFGLAQVLDAQGNYGAAAECLQEANAAEAMAIAHRHRGYNPAEHASFMSGVLATFTPQFFARTRGFGLETELPVFIVGLPRSGSTLVEQILASHSRVFAGGELRYCDETFRSLPAAMQRNDTPLECLGGLDRETARRLARRHVDRLRALDAGALRIVDKMPQNYQHLGFIGVLFPKARLIHCRRDLRDVALSCWMTKFAMLPWACQQDQIVSQVEAHARVMDHWRKVLPAPLLEVDYEQMVADTEGMARRIVAWCGLEWEAGCLRFYETQRPVQTASKTQVRRPIYTTSVGRWKNYETLLGELFSRVQRFVRK